MKNISRACTQFQSEVEKYLVAYPNIKRTFYWGHIDIRQTIFSIKACDAYRFKISRERCSFLEVEQCNFDLEKCQLTNLNEWWWFQALTINDRQMMKRDIEYVHRLKIVFEGEDQDESASTPTYDTELNSRALATLNIFPNLDTVEIYCGWSPTTGWGLDFLKLSEEALLPVSAWTLIEYSALFGCSNSGKELDYMTPKVTPKVELHFGIPGKDPKPVLVRLWVGTNK
jgi:hypothetical protein